MSLDSTRPGNKCRTIFVAAVCLVAGVVLTLAYQRHLCTRPGLGLVSEPGPLPQPWWKDLHERYVATIQKSEEGKGHDVIFYGDGIIEAWAGTYHGQPAGRFNHSTEVFDWAFGDPFNALAMGIAGDKSAQVEWRLANGELPPSNTSHPPKVVVLYMGANDLKAARWGAPSEHQIEQYILAAVPGITLSTLRTVHAIRTALPKTFVVLQALLPMGGESPDIYSASNVFKESIDIVNDHLATLASRDEYIQFLDCGDHLLWPDGRIDPALMPDAMHPSAHGYDMLGLCGDLLIRRLVEHPPVEKSKAGN